MKLVRLGARILGAAMIALIVSGAAWQKLGPASAEEVAVARETGRPITVFFSRQPESAQDFTAVYPVTRTAPDAGVARAALNALIDGPTPEEAADGYYAELGQMLDGPSTCGGPDYAIRIEAGTATVTFCRRVVSAGIGQDARVMNALDATLRQFPTIQRVRLLDDEGNCLFDMSGLNRCLADA
jgi:hypothetical protein